jgi:hypothetical protein
VPKSVLAHDVLYDLLQMLFTQCAHGLRRDDLHVLDLSCPSFPQVVETQAIINFVCVDPKDCLSTQEPAAPIAVVLVQGNL